MSTDSHRPPAAKVMNEAIDLAIEVARPIPNGRRSSTPIRPSRAMRSSALRTKVCRSSSSQRTAAPGSSSPIWLLIDPAFRLTVGRCVGSTGQGRRDNVGVGRAVAQLVEPQLWMLVQDGRGDVERRLACGRDMWTDVFEQEGACVAVNQGGSALESVE